MGWKAMLHSRVRTFGGFQLGDEFFYGEIIGDEVHILENPYWIDIEPTEAWPPGNGVYFRSK